MQFNNEPPSGPLIEQNKLNQNLSNDQQNKFLNGLIQMQQQQHFEDFIKELIKQQQQLSHTNFMTPIAFNFNPLSALLPAAIPTILQLKTGLIPDMNNVAPVLLQPIPTNITPLMPSANANLISNGLTMARVIIEYNLNTSKIKTANKKETSPSLIESRSDSCEQLDPQSNLKCVTYLIKKRKIVFGRRVITDAEPEYGKEIVIHDGLETNGEQADIFIENSTLVSRQHFSIELDKDDNSSFWLLTSISKNGIFLNSHYLEKGKSIRLTHNNDAKKQKLRFPNTNIKILFESLIDVIDNQTENNKKLIVSNNELKNQNDIVKEENGSDLKNEPVIMETHNGHHKNSIKLVNQPSMNPSVTTNSKKGGYIFHFKHKKIIENM